MAKDYFKIIVGYRILSVAILLIIIGLYSDINFLWEFGTVLLISEVIVQRYKDKILYTDVKRAMREILGIRSPGAQLFPELVNLIRENEYHVVKREIKDKMFYSEDKNKHFNMFSVSEETIVIIPKINNIHYCFERGSGESKKPVEVSKVSCEELNQINSKNGLNFEEYNPKNAEEILKYKEGDNTFYKICKQLRKGKIYRFKIRTHYPECLSDLRVIKEGDEDTDWIDYRFIMPTQSFVIELYFPFDLKRYNFHIKRLNLSRTSFRVLSSKDKENLYFDHIENKIRIFQENFDKGDLLQIIYSKK